MYAAKSGVKLWLNNKNLSHHDFCQEKTHSILRTDALVSNSFEGRVTKKEKKRTQNKVNIRTVFSCQMGHSFHPYKQQIIVRKVLGPSKKPGKKVLSQINEDNVLVQRRQTSVHDLSVTVK